MSFVAVATAIGATIGLSGTAATVVGGLVLGSAGLGLGEQVYGLTQQIGGGPPAAGSQPAPLTTAQNQAVQTAAKTSASQATPAPQGATGTQALEQQIFQQRGANPQEWGDIVAGVAQALGGGALSAGPHASAASPGLATASGAGSSIFDVLRGANPSGAAVPGGAAPGSGGASSGAGTDMISSLLSRLSGDIFHGFSA